ncbi:(2Fe-2S)-binding protein [Paraburkholderia aspalathi]|nr:(2Fe-2S)-binding protein [Paraburkholderia aspalathi]
MNDSIEMHGRAMVPIHIDELLFLVPEEMSVAAALMLVGVQRFSARPVHGGARVPYCMIGVCFECVVDIDDLPGHQACMTTVRVGMRIRTRGAMSRLAHTTEIAPRANAATLDILYDDNHE